MKLSDFLKQQGDTPQGKSTYQAFIDNFDKDYDAESFRKDEKGSIAAAFQWDICPEDLEFWDIVDNKWQEVTDPENDMLWLLDGKEPPKETDEELSKQKEYPRWFKYKGFGKIIIEFLDLTSGIVVDAGTTNEAIGTLYTGLWPHTNSDVWQEVPNPELTQEKRTPIDDNEIDRLLDEVNNIDGKNHLDTILAERAAKYGSFASQAAFAQYLKTTLHEHRNWDELRDSQKEALEMIMHKISRILNGDPNYDDSWRDIAGYAELIVKELNETTIKG